MCSLLPTDLAFRNYLTSLQLMLNRVAALKIIPYIIIVVINRVNQTESAILFSLVCPLLPKDLAFRTYLSSLQLMLNRVAALKISPCVIASRSVGYMFSLSFVYL